LENTCFLTWPNHRKNERKKRKTERKEVVSIPAPHFGGLGFKSRPPERSFVIFLTTTTTPHPWANAWVVLQIRPQPLPSIFLQFIIQY
jgi:hypothetical protein